MLIEVSVLMSVFNDEKYVQQAIESILNQTFIHFEFIIILDAPTDNSEHVVQEYASKDGRIKVIKNEKNMGLAKSLNMGLSLASGKYIARQDSDDFSDTERLQHQYDYLEKHTEIALAGTNTAFIDIEGNYLYETKMFSAYNDKNFFDLLMERKCILPHGTAFMRKDVIVELGGYNEDWTLSQDYELWLRFCRNGFNVQNLHETLYYHRKNPVKTTEKSALREDLGNILISYYQSKISHDELSESTKAIFKKYDNNGTIDKYYLSDYWYSMALSTMKEHNILLTWKLLAKSLREKNDISRVVLKLLSFFVPFIPYRIAIFFKPISTKYRRNS